MGEMANKTSEVHIQHFMLFEFSKFRSCQSIEELSNTLNQPYTTDFNSAKQEKVILLLFENRFIYFYFYTHEVILGKKYINIFVNWLFCEILLWLDFFTTMYCILRMKQVLFHILLCSYLDPLTKLNCIFNWKINSRLWFVFQKSTFKSPLKIICVDFDSKEQFRLRLWQVNSRESFLSLRSDFEI